MYKLTLEDGSVLDGLELNGNCYISDENVSETLFIDNLGTVEVFDGENTKVHQDMVLARLWVDSGKTWIALGDKTEAEKYTERLEATITDLQLALTEMYESLLGGA